MGPLKSAARARYTGEWYDDVHSENDSGPHFLGRFAWFPKGFI